MLSGTAVVLGLAALLMPIPELRDAARPEEELDWDFAPHGRSEVAGGPVMVLNTWVIADDDLEEFLEALDALRVVRFRTGAYRWRVYRNVEDPHRITEVFNVDSWAGHLKQHERIDAEAAAIIRRAWAFDARGAPVGRHLVAFDITDPKHRPDWERLSLRHRDAHERDGSIPLMTVEEE